MRNCPCPACTARDLDPPLRAVLFSAASVCGAVGNPTLWYPLGIYDQDRAEQVVPLGLLQRGPNVTYALTSQGTQVVAAWLLRGIGLPLRALDHAS